MKKILPIILFLSLSLLAGCGSTESENITGETVTSDTEGQKVLVSSKESFESDYWLQAQYINNTLYYVTYERSEADEELYANLYARADNDKSVLKISSTEALPDSIAVDTNENIYFISRTEVDEDNTYFLHKLAADGKELYCHEVSDISACIEKEGLIEAIADDDGYYVLTGKGTCLTWDVQGDNGKQIEATWYQSSMDHDVNLDFGILNGCKGAYIFHTNGLTICLQSINGETGSIGEEIMLQLPANIGTNTDVRRLFQLFSGYEEGIFVYFGKNLYCYNDEGQKLTEIVNWNDSDYAVNMDYVRTVGTDADGLLILYGYDSDKGEPQYTKLEEKAASEIYQDTVVIGHVYGTGLENFVSDFNASQSDIFVVLKEYEDMTALQLDLIKGDGPDILSMFRLDVDEYTEKGILEDLSPYFEASEELNAEDLLPALREIMTVDGGIRFFMPSFSIRTLVLRDGVSEDNVLDTEEYLSLVNEGDGYLCNDNALSLLGNLYPQEQINYLDWENQSCSFDDGRFAAFLETLQAADLPATGDTKQSNLSLAEQLYDGECLSIFADAYSFDEYLLIKEIFDECAEIKGYPNRQGEEVYPINVPGVMLSMNSASKSKDAAWKFLEYYMLDCAERGNDSSDSFSVFQSVFEEQLYSTAKGLTFFGCQYTGEDFKMEAKVTEEDREMIRYMVDNAVWDNNIIDGTVGMIIYSESIPYLLGEKTVEEVVDIIQSRVSIYMAE